MKAERKKHYTEAELNKLLPDDVSKQYKAVNLGKRSTAKFYSQKYGAINLKTISLKKVEHLVKQNCPYFVLKGKS